MPSVPDFHILNSDHQDADASLAETVRKVLMKIIAVKTAMRIPIPKIRNP
jgi:hypothetical protein